MAIRTELVLFFITQIPHYQISIDRKLGVNRKNGRLQIRIKASLICFNPELSVIFIFPFSSFFSVGKEKIKVTISAHFCNLKLQSESFLFCYRELLSFR